MVPGLLYATIRCADDRCVQLTVREVFRLDIRADEIGGALAIIADAVKTARAGSSNDIPRVTARPQSVASY
jgi:hypothetical protein